MGGKKLPQTFSELIADEKKQIEKILSTQKKIFQGLVQSNSAITTTMKIGKHIRAIINFSNEFNPDIIMLTTKEKMGISRYLNSSNALRIMNQLSVPILIFPQDYEVKRELRLNFLIEHFDNLELAKSMTVNFKDIFNDMRFLHREPSGEKQSTDEIQVVRSIENYINDSECDEIFMLIRKKKMGIQKVLGKGFVKKLIGLNQAPVIIINE
jgi:hypothetical protein